MPTQLSAVNWLQYYGITRYVGKSVEEAIALCDLPSEQAGERFEAMVQMSRASEEALEGQVSSFIGMARAGVSLIPVVGSALSYAFKGIEWVFNLAQENSAWGCHRSCQPGYKDKLLGLGSGCHSGMDKLAAYLHDGLVYDGLRSPDEEDHLGRKFGVKTWRSPEECRGACDEYQGLNDSFYNLLPVEVLENPGDYDATVFPFYGFPWGDCRAPWRDPGNNWAYRGWRVASLIAWFGEAVPCNVLMCANDILRQLRTVAYRAANDIFGARFSWERTHYASVMMSLTGSRWYASLYKMHTDLVEAAQSTTMARIEAVSDELGIPEFGQRWRAVNSSALSETTRAMLPWDWYYATAIVPWDKVKPLIQGLRPVIIGRVTSPWLTSARVARYQGGLVETGRVVDVPAEGSSGAGKVVLGVGAAALTLFALKKLLGA